MSSCNQNLLAKIAFLPLLETAIATKIVLFVSLYSRNQASIVATRFVPVGTKSDSLILFRLWVIDMWKPLVFKYIPAYTAEGSGIFFIDSMRLPSDWGEAQGLG